MLAQSWRWADAEASPLVDCPTGQLPTGLYGHRDMLAQDVDRQERRWGPSVSCSALIPSPSELLLMFLLMFPPTQLHETGHFRAPAKQDRYVTTCDHESSGESGLHG